MKRALHDKSVFDKKGKMVFLFKQLQFQLKVSFYFSVSVKDKMII